MSKKANLSGYLQNCYARDILSETDKMSTDCQQRRENHSVLKICLL